MIYNISYPTHIIQNANVHSGAKQGQTGVEKIYCANRFASQIMAETNQCSFVPYDVLSHSSLLYDIKLVFGLLHFLLSLFLPLRPFCSAELDELFPSSVNLRDIFLHFMYTLFQLFFLISFSFFLFTSFFIAYIFVFVWINKRLQDPMHAHAE